MHARSRRRRRQGRLVALAALLLIACQTTGVNPTGLTGGRAACQEGLRQTLDCRGAIQQYARDFKLELSGLTTGQAAAAVGSNASKLTEADALSSDLVQHYYQTCALYNACLISQHEYVTRTEKLQEIQLAVRHALVASGYGAQQSIQINPPVGGVGLPPGAPGPPGGVALPPGAPGQAPLGGPVPQRAPGPGLPGAPQAPAGAPSSGPAVATQPPASNDPVDAVLRILREGNQVLRQQQPLTGQPQAAAKAPPGVGPAAAMDAEPQPPRGATPLSGRPHPVEDLDSRLRNMLATLKQDIAGRNAALASAGAVVGNFTEEGQPWSGPVGAMLRDRVAALVESAGLFRPAPAMQARGITIKQVAAVADPNDPKALGALYQSDVAIAGTYRPEREVVTLRLIAFDAAGAELAQTATAVPSQALPSLMADAPANAAGTKELLHSLQQLGPKSAGAAKVAVTTNRPGNGASFRAGEEIKYFVTSAREGFLYLFHVDANKNMRRIFPNRYQRESRIAAGAALEVPAPGAPFTFEASPPFGLETTFAIVTMVPLDERDFQIIENGFAKPTHELPTLVASRGLSASTNARDGAPPVVWNAVTVLIRP